VHGLARGSRREDQADTDVIPLASKIQLANEMLSSAVHLRDLIFTCPRAFQHRPAHLSINTLQDSSAIDLARANAPLQLLLQLWS
jgi:hypothetical protein